MTTLIKYEQSPTRFFGDGEWDIEVKLYLQKTYLFGLIKRTIIHYETITMFHDYRNTIDNWDFLIKSKTPIKRKK